MQQLRSLHMFYLYKITNKINNKSYIGFSYDAEKRFKQHIFEAYNKNSPSYHTIFHRSIRKYGQHNFTQEIIYQSLYEEHIKESEEFFIRENNTHYKFGYGYNMTYGGEGTKGIYRNDATRKRMSDAQRGKIKSPETKQKLFESMLRYGQKLAKQWEITDPDGNTFIITNLRRFCLENNLDQGNMMKVAKGKCKHCKNYLVRKM